MKSLLVLAVCLTAVLAAEKDSLNQQLLRVLASLEKKSVDQQQTSSQRGRDNSANGGQNGNSYKNQMLKPKPEPIDVQEFKEVLQGWEQIAREYVGKVHQLKPLALQSLTRRKSWKEVATKTEEMFGHAAALYDKIWSESLMVSHRLFENAEGFGRSGRCRKMANLAEAFDASEALAEIKSTEALISDLDCFAGEIEDTISALSVKCADGEHFGVDEALGMMGRVMQTLYRFRKDGLDFGAGALLIEDKYDEVYNLDQADPSVK